MFQTRIFIASTKNLENKKAFKDFYEKVPDYRKRKIDSCSSEKEKRLSLAAGILLSKAILYAGFDESCLDYDYKESGMPYFKNEPNLHFSISKSEERAICAISENPIGVDVEFIKEKNEKDYEAWTKTESYAKATNTNLADLIEGKTVFNTEFRFYFPSFKDGYKYAICSEEFLNEQQIEYLTNLI